MDLCHYFFYYIEFFLLFSLSFPVSHYEGTEIFMQCARIKWYYDYDDDYDDDDDDYSV